MLLRNAMNQADLRHFHLMVDSKHSFQPLCLVSEGLAICFDRVDDRNDVQVVCTNHLVDGLLEDDDVEV